MNKIKLIFPVLLLGALVLMGAGCGEKAAEEGGAPIIGEEEEGQGEEVSLDEVLTKAKGMEGYSFDIVVTQTDQPTMESKMWVEGTDMRWEGNVEGQDIVYILNTAQETAYIYMPSQNMAMEQSFAEVSGEVGESPAEEAEGIPEQNPDVLGIEVWDGKTCLLVKSTSDQGDVTKWWLWTEYGIPIKTEITSHTGEIIVTELHNIEVGDIAGSMFELPAGVQIMEIPFGF
jgi:outer membrane lipoprotein-sorting protein